jgi:hypothetical protein
MLVRLVSCDSGRPVIMSFRIELNRAPSHRHGCSDEVTQCRNGTLQSSSGVGIFCFVMPHVCGSGRLL